MIPTTIACLMLVSAPQDPPPGAQRPTEATETATPAVPSTPPARQVESAKKPKRGSRDVIPNAEMLPGDSLAVVAVAPLSAHRIDLMRSGLHDLLSWVGTSWHKAPFLDRLLLAPVDLETLSSMGFSLAITHIRAPGSGLFDTAEIGWVLVAPTGRRSIAIRRSLTSVHRAHEKEGRKIRVDVMDDEQCWSVSTPGGPQVSYRITDDMLFLGDSPESIQNAINQLGDVDSSLAAAGSYDRFAARCSAEGQPWITVLIQPQPALAQAIEFLPGQIAKQKIRSVIRQIQLDKISELGMSLFVEGGEVRDFVWMRYPSPREGLLAALFESQKTIHREQFHIIAPEATAVSLFTLDVDRVFRESLVCTKFLDSSLRQLIQTSLEKIESESGVDVEADILSQLGEHGVVQEWTADRETRVFGLTFSLQDGIKLTERLDSIAGSGAIKKARIGMTPVYVIGNDGDGDKAFVSVLENALIVGNSPRFVQRILGLLTEERSVGATPKIAQLVKSNGVLPKAFVWGDATELGQQWLRTLSLNSGHREFASELTQLIRTRSGSLISTLEVTEDGMTLRNRSPFGNLYLVLGSSFLLKTLDLQGDSNEAVDARRMTILYDIVAAQHDYRNSRHSDGDNDRNGEFATLDQLVEAGLLHEGWFDNTAPYMSDGYRFDIFLPRSTDARETDFLVMTWPSENMSGVVYTTSSDGSLRANKILGGTGGLTSCDLRDYFHQGKFGNEVLPGWELLESKSINFARFEEATPTRNLTDEEKRDLDTLDAVEKNGAITSRILALLDSKSPFVAGRAADVIGNLRFRSGVPQLCTAIRVHKSVSVRRKAMAALTKMRDTQSVDASIDALSSPDLVIRTLAAQNLGFLHAHKATKALLDVLTVQAKPDAKDHVAALLALADIGEPDCLVPASARIKGGGKDKEKALAYLFQTLSSKLEPVREAETLMAVLDHESELLRRFAIQRLGVLALPIAEGALKSRLYKDKKLKGLIEVSLTVIREAQASEKLKGYVSNAKAKGTEIWNSLPAHVAYGTTVALFLLIIVVSKIRRRRIRARRGERFAAMVAPSEGFQSSYSRYGNQDGYDDQYDDPYDDEDAYDDDQFDEEIEDSGGELDPDLDVNDADDIFDEEYFEGDPMGDYFEQDEVHGNDWHMNR